MIVRVIDGVVTQISLKQIKKEYPDTSFPVDLVVGRDYHTEYDFYVVDVKDKPALTEGQRIVPLEIEMVDGVYTQQYVAADIIVSTDPNDYILTPYQFKRFYRGSTNKFYLAVNAVLAYFEYNDEDAWGLYSAEIEDRSQYHFAAMFAFIGSEAVAPLIPENVDVSYDNMAAAWLLAKDL